MDRARIEAEIAAGRGVPPPETFQRQAWVDGPEAYNRLYQESLMDPGGFWGRAAGELVWARPWERVLAGEWPEVRWFVGGAIDLGQSLLDRWVEAGRGDRPALYWRGIDGRERRLTYAELADRVARFAGALAQLGVAPGDRVAIYLPPLVEAAVAVLAAFRLGAVAVPVFSGLSPAAALERILRVEPTVLVSADGFFRGDGPVAVAAPLLEGLRGRPFPAHRVWVERTGHAFPHDPARDLGFEELLQAPAHPSRPRPAGDPLLVVFTSGPTGRPQGVVHTAGGYPVYAHLTARLVLDQKPEDVVWVTSDLGRQGGQSYALLAPLLSGATTVLFEGVGNALTAERVYRVLAGFGVRVLYAAPPVYRRLRGAGPPPAPLALRLMVSGDAPIDPATWLWAYLELGQGSAPLVEAWGQTEGGGAMLATLPGAHRAKPGYAGFPLPGIVPRLLGADGRPVDDPRRGGYLALAAPWPGLMKGLWQDPERYRHQYFQRFPGHYFTGDAARTDAEGYYQILGRVDEVLNVAGQRIGSAEIEAVLKEDPHVAEAVVVPRPDPTEGEVVVAFVVLRNPPPPEGLAEALARRVAERLGAHAQPAEVVFLESLPKTPSGKVMRRHLRRVARGDDAS